MTQKITKSPLLCLTFSLPPLTDQQDLVAALATARADAAASRAEADATRTAARAAFEAAVYEGDATMASVAA